MRITHLMATGLLAAALPAQLAFADADGERAALARIIHELQTIDPLITEAASQSNPDARVRPRTHSSRDSRTHRCPALGATNLSAATWRLPSVMFGHDGGAERSIPGGLRFYAGNSAHGYRIGDPGTHLRLGDLGITRHLPRMAERAGGTVRRGLECVTRQHRAHGAGLLSAVAASSLPQGFGDIPRYS